MKMLPIFSLCFIAVPLTAQVNTGELRLKVTDSTGLGSRPQLFFPAKPANISVNSPLTLTARPELKLWLTASTGWTLKNGASPPS
jgi:hypothetical protein